MSQISYVIAWLQNTVYAGIQSEKNKFIRKALF